MVQAILKGAIIGCEQYKRPEAKGGLSLGTPSPLNTPPGVRTSFVDLRNYVKTWRAVPLIRGYGIA